MGYIILPYEKVLTEIENFLNKSKKERIRICIQVPDGLKPIVNKIVDKIEKKFGNKVIVWIWFDSCYGACDYPWYLKDLDFDLILHIGHKEIKYG